MTIRSVGYDGSIGELDWSVYLAPYLGSPDMVARTGDFKVTATTGLSVQVAPGLAHAWGVTAVSDAAETIQLDSVGTGSRYDAVVLRRDWSGSSVTPTGATTGGLTSVAVVKGGAAPVVPTVQARGGVLTEQPLALVKVTAGATTVTIADDLRTTHAKAAYVRSLLAMTGPLGTRYTLEPEGRRYVMTASGPAVEWEPPPVVVPPIPKIQAGTATGVTFNASGAATITHGLGWRPKVFLATARLASSSPGIEIALSSQAGPMTDQVAIVTAKRMSGGTDGWAPYTSGLSYLDWIAMA